MRSADSSAACIPHRVFGLFAAMLFAALGADVMKRIAAPMIGGVVTSTLLELLIYPVIFVMWKERYLKRLHAAALAG